MMQYFFISRTLLLCLIPPTTQAVFSHLPNITIAISVSGLALRVKSESGVRSFRIKKLKGKRSQTYGKLREGGWKLNKEKKEAEKVNPSAGHRRHVPSSVQENLLRNSLRLRFKTPSSFPYWETKKSAALDLAKRANREEGDLNDANTKFPRNELK